MSLGLADGRLWLIRASDPAAARVVSALAEVMQLAPGTRGRELLVATSPAGFQPTADSRGEHPLACTVAPPDNPTC